MKTVVLVVLILVALALGYKTIHDWGSNKEYQHQIDSLKQQESGLITVYRTDTIRLTRWLTKYDTLYKDQHITDTIWVKQFVLTADSTIKSCSAALNTCELEKANLRAQLVLEQKKHPGRFGCTAGVAANQKGVGLGGACGVRVSF